MCKLCTLKVYFVDLVFSPFFQRAGFDGFQAISQIEGWPNMPHASPILMKKSYSACSKLSEIHQTLFRQAC